MSVMVIVCLKPKPGADDGLLQLVKTHLPKLREQGLVGDDPSLCGRAKDGTIIEVFCWKSEAAIQQAHENLAVQKMWEEFSDVCGYVKIADVPEALEMFSGFEAIDLSSS